MENRDDNIIAYCDPANGRDIGVIVIGHVDHMSSLGSRVAMEMNRGIHPTILVIDEAREPRPSMREMDPAILAPVLRFPDLSGSENRRNRRKNNRKAKLKRNGKTR